MSCEFITFVNNTPDGIDWKRIVITSEFEINKLKGGAAHLGNPKEYNRPGWLSAGKATEIWELHTGKNKEFHTEKNKDSVSGQDTATIFWKYFKKKAVRPSYEDFSPYYLKKVGKWKEDDESKNLNPVGVNMTEQAAPKRKRITIPGDSKIGVTGKQPKSEKNIARLNLYRRGKLSSILEKNPEITLADIKYDIKCGYAEILG